MSAGKVVKAALDKVDGPPAPDAPAGQLPEVTGLDAETVEFLTRASGGELRSMLGTELRFMRWKRAAKIAAKAAAHLQRVGREAGQAELKVLLPALEAGSLEEDEEMADRWAALLANAADPQGSAVEPGFSDVLRQLSRNDAVLLEYIVERARQRGGAIPWTMPDFDTAEINTTGPIRDPDDFVVSLDNLFRLRILVLKPSGRMGQLGVRRHPLGGTRILFNQDRFKLSAYGAKFARAVRREE